MKDILERVNAGEIVVIDDFVPAHVQDDVERELTRDDFPWYYQNSSLGGLNQWQKEYSENTPNVYDTPQMIHCFIDYNSITLDELIQSNWKYVSDKIMQPDFFSGYNCLRIKANLKYRCEKFIDHCIPHSDGFGFGIVGLYYVDESDGETVFFNEKVQHPEDDYVTPTIRERITPKKGTMVFFHKGLLHAAGNPHQSFRRIVINFNFVPNKFTFVEQICDSPHGTRKLSDHLLGVYKLLEGDGASQEVCDAGLFHSIYGTEIYKHKTIKYRDIVKQLIGIEAENLAHMFCELKLPREKAIYEIGDPKIRSQLLDIHEANEIEQEDDHMGLNYEWLFPVIFGWERLDLDLSKLEQYAFKLKEQGPGRVLSNDGGWQSENLNHNEPELSEVKALINNTLDEYWSAHKYPGILTVDNMWLNINGSRDSNHLHVHPNSIISGVIYILVPQDGEPGSISFENPHKTILKNCWNFESDCPQIWKKCEYYPEPGKLVLFPSWVEHSVSPNKSNSWRISLSFNSSLRYND